MMQSFRDGVDPNWRKLGSSILYILEGLLIILFLVASLANYNAGHYDKATLDLVLVLLIRSYSSSRR
jgi:hypothetical protein